MIGSSLDLRVEQFESLFNQGLSDYKIAKIMNKNHATIFQWRRKHGYVRKSLKENVEIPLNQNNLEVLLGTLLGDGSLSKPFKNARYSNSHNPKQQEYCKYIAEQFINLKSVVQYSKRTTPDKRNGLIYEEYCCRIPCNPALNYLYQSFYVNHKKRIPFELLKDFTAKSLAFLYMDDGSKASCGYDIATMCFTEVEILKFRKFLFNKFNLETTMPKDKRIHIRAKSKNHFKELILPYMHKTMLYKL